VDIQTGTERDLLEAFLTANRAEIKSLLDGVTDAQARQRLVPSLTTLLGLVKHAAFVERVWFEVTLAGRTRAELGLPPDIDATFTLADDDTIDAIRASYDEATARADAIVKAHSLDDHALHHRLGRVSLRWIYLHMIEELARHAGHGDILKEQLHSEGPPADG
jgi:uncharacterized damage-inducible protein DinB